MSTSEQDKRKIQLVWDGDNINVNVDGSPTLKVDDKLKGALKAKDIFESFGYHYGDKYVLLPLNIEKDNSAYSFVHPFYQLYEELCKEINEIEIDDENTKDIKLDL